MKHHTPGPFKIGAECTDIMNPDVVSTGSRFHSIDAPGHVALAVVVTKMADDSGSGTTPEMLMGNARVFAAAPDLLAACQAVLETNAEFRKEYPQVTEEAPCVALVRAAIAKATGSGS